MTPDQAKQLDTKLILIRSELQHFFIPHPSLDNAEANSIIAEARMKLSQIDQQLFECYRLLDRFYDTNRPHVVRKHTAPTIDDLEI